MVSLAPWRGSTPPMKEANDTLRAAPSLLCHTAVFAGLAREGIVIHRALGGGAGDPSCVAAAMAQIASLTAERAYQHDSPCNVILGRAGCVRS
mmetsp:Transcript_3017/g.9408  ORF Transcript_3017/g.9408 Transcript_3017/m.9408 type:complete len:93 (+) Transcript_3017:184-462(+)